MGYGRDRRERGRDKRKANGYGLLPSEGSVLSREKLKARKLRDTSWWRKKCAAGLCHYCGRKIRSDELTMDHVIPLSRGGMSERYNIVPACKDCNNKKKYLLPAEWEEYLNSIRNKSGMEKDNEPDR